MQLVNRVGLGVHDVQCAVARHRHPGDESVLFRQTRNGETGQGCELIFLQGNAEDGLGKRFANHGIDGGSRQIALKPLGNRAPAGDKDGRAGGISRQTCPVFPQLEGCAGFCRPRCPRCSRSGRDTPRSRPELCGHPAEEAPAAACRPPAPRFFRRESSSNRWATRWATRSDQRAPPAPPAEENLPQPQERHTKPVSK